MGNDLVPPFQYLTSYEFTRGSIFGSNRDYLFGLKPDGAPNPLITWETANVYNVGFESKLLNKMILNADFFYQNG